MGTSWRCKCPTLRPTRKNVEKKKWSQSVPVYTKNKKIPGTLYAVSIHEKDEKVRECPIRYDMNMNERRAQAATYVRKNEWSCFVSKFEITPGKDSNAPTRRLRPQKHYTSYYDGRQTWLAALIRLSAVTHGTLTRVVHLIRAVLVTAIIKQDIFLGEIDCNLPWIVSRTNLYSCGCCLHIKPLFLSNISSTQYPSWFFILERYKVCGHREWDREKPNAKESR